MDPLVDHVSLIALRFINVSEDIDFNFLYTSLLDYRSHSIIL